MPAPDEILEEIFLRLPLDEPEHLVRASLANKLWLGLLSGARFRGRYHEFHGGAPPMLGFIYSLPDEYGRDKEDKVQCFFPTTKFRGRIHDDDLEWEYTPWDCRHGRVLLGDHDDPMPLVVWDPMTARRRKLDMPAHLVESNYAAAVLCAVTGCDHRACHTGPIQVVFVGLEVLHDDSLLAQACVSLPVTWGSESDDSHFDKWSEPCPGLHLERDTFIEQMPPVFIQGALHFKLYNFPECHVVGILRYDLASHCLSLIDAPAPYLPGSATSKSSYSILMAMEDGSLCFAHLDRHTLNLCLWSRNMGSDDGVVSWTQRTSINLGNLLPIQNPKKKLRLIGSVEGGDIIFVNTSLDIYEINLKTARWKQLPKREKLHSLIPYMSFYNPKDLQNDGDKKNLLEGSSALQQMAVRAHDTAGAPPTGGLPRTTKAGEEDLESGSDEN